MTGRANQSSIGVQFATWPVSFFVIASGLIVTFFKDGVVAPSPFGVNEAA
jgi:hypothetical protein